MHPPLIQFDAITKTFAGVTALDNVSLSIPQGGCHALMGENGAGKSTLGKILSGIYRPDGGVLRIDGQPVRFHSPRDAAQAGIGMVHQELAFCPELSVAENLALGRYPRRLGFWVDHRAMVRRARELLGQIGAEVDVHAPVGRLSTAQEQLVQIAAAVGAGARILVFDEPTSSLSEVDAQRLFALIGRLKARGTTIIYVSHRMPEVFALCDRVSVLRDGRYVGMLERGEATPDRVVEMMIGRQLVARQPRHLGQPPGAVALRVRGLSSRGRFSNVSFDVRAGEIVGLAGLVGSGRSEVAQAIFGLDPAATGEVEVQGRPMALGAVRAAMRRGMGLVPEDRKRQGLVLMMGGRENLTLPLLDLFGREVIARAPLAARPPVAGGDNQPGFNRRRSAATEPRGVEDGSSRSAFEGAGRRAVGGPRQGGGPGGRPVFRAVGRVLRFAGFLDQRAEARLARDYFTRLDVRAASLETPVVALSGGNQQKVVLAKWLARGCRVLLIDEPTRGVDVAAKAAIHAILDQLALDGAAILLISSELPEILNLSTRVLVMREGRLAGEMGRADATQERLLHRMAGGEVDRL